MEQDQKKIINFEDIKDRIVLELEKRSEKLQISEPVTLVDGFLNEPFSKELSNSFVVGGPTIPMVMLVGNESGKIYFFALKALIKDIWN